MDPFLGPFPCLITSSSHGQLHVQLQEPVTNFLVLVLTDRYRALAVTFPFGGANHLKLEGRIRQDLMILRLKGNLYVDKSFWAWNFESYP